MRKNIQILLLVFALLMLADYSVSAQMRVAIIPYSNLDGNFAYNKYCYELQDSLTKAFEEADPDHKHIIVVSAEDVNNALSDKNVDANTPTFDVDKWNIVPDLHVDRIISGTFRITGNRFLINSYVYYPDTQLSDPDYQAKDIFKKEEKILESVPIIVRKLSKAFELESGE